MWKKNSNLFCLVVLLIFISSMSYAKFWVGPQKDIRNQEILKHALELYVNKGELNLKDAYGTTMKYESYHSKYQIYVMIESAGPSRSFENFSDNINIRWSVETDFLDIVPVDRHLEFGSIIYHRNLSSVKELQNEFQTNPINQIKIAGGWGMSDYWRNCVDDAFEDAGLVATDEQKETVAGWFESGHMHYGQAHGHECIPNPLEAENERLRRKLDAEQAKRVCPECKGRGFEVSHGPSHSATMECMECRGEGKV